MIIYIFIIANNTTNRLFLGALNTEDEYDTWDLFVLIGCKGESARVADKFRDSNLAFKLSISDLV